jgi:hypothetical protein
MADLDPVDRKIIFEIIFSSPEAGDSSVELGMGVASPVCGDISLKTPFLMKTEN